MVNKIIAFIKKSPFLYNLAKRVNRAFAKTSNVPKKAAAFSYYVYIMKSEDELDKIIEHYNEIKKFNTKLFVLVDNKKLNILIHKFIRENPDICFASFDYFKKYRSKLSNYRVMWLNYTDADRQLLNYLA